MLAFGPWRGAEGHPPLDEDSVHLWRVQVGPGGTDPAGLWSLLSLPEQARAERLATQTLRDRYVRTHGCLRQILSQYLKQHPHAIVFKESERGKPEVAQTAAGLRRRIEFNLTGSHELALVAITLNLPIGVDCEFIRPRREILGIARRMFARQTVEALERTPEPQRLHAFYAEWTALEAQVKADGRGLFRPQDPTAPLLTTAHFSPQSGYVASVSRERLPAAHLWAGYAWPGNPRSSPSAPDDDQPPIAPVG